MQAMWTKAVMQMGATTRETQQPQAQVEGDNVAVVWQGQGGARAVGGGRKWGRWGVGLPNMAISLSIVFCIINFKYYYYA
jgi:hypothetical protein